VTTATPDDPNPREPDQPRSRLDQEIDDILTRSGADKLKGPKRTPKPPDLRSIRGGQSSQARPAWLKTSSGAFWMVLALVIAFVAVLVADASPLLARLLVFAAVASFLVPIVQRFRGTSSPPPQKMWRGRPIEIEPQQPSPLDQIRDWWRRRSGR
jgi:hypothetical protein